MCDDCRAAAMKHLAGPAATRGMVWVESLFAQHRGRPWRAHEGLQRVALRRIADLTRDATLAAELATRFLVAAERHWAALEAREQESEAVRATSVIGGRRGMARAPEPLDRRYTGVRVVPKRS